ncbi:flagella basal body P-ring formation protein FlgA [Sphingomonas sp. LB-2]|uniref:flagella basal body P-ring formation protein FlgA n=1 Tax=Sphingomonas caeni TaxID=2984949 RepID=UPI0022314004|nr:flagella basal body P-ring formation protein FlgA [Sphingomonas caeni]MCW3846905.1 flagella basal body P-ring formation protein FlgA [Sphingomonas caeni]
MKLPFLALALVATPALAQDFQSTQLLDTIVAQFTGHNIGQMGGAIAPVDVRLKLAACAAPQLEWHTDAHQAVVVRCMAPEWKIFVPVLAPPPPKPAPAVAAPVRPAAAQAPAPVPAKPEIVIKRGDTVTLEAGGPGFSITREGVAMSDAPAGGRVMIRVDDKKPPIQAIAIEAGLAKLPGSGE